MSVKAGQAQSERMGHEVPGIRGVYSHVSPTMRTDLVAALQERWQAALRARVQIAPRSSVRLLNELLTAAVTEGQDRPSSGSR